MSDSRSALEKFSKFAWLVLAYTVVVIMWGAFVRATGSGAGCGEHWPLCNGEVIPRDPGMARIIEFSHRLTSGLSLILVGALFIWSRRLFAPGHGVRKAAGWSLLFILGEAAVGAVLVVLQLVAGNDSVLRAIVIAFHLVNTFLLLFWQTRVAFLANPLRTPQYEEKNAHASKARVNIMICMVAFALTGAAGAIVALGDTLFPAKSLAEGMAEDFSATAHFLIRLRIWHPLIALASTCYIALQSLILPRVFGSVVQGKLGFLVCILMIAQLAGGVLNWLLLAPIWMQLVHLMFADITWIVMCLWYFNTGRKGANPEEAIQ
jgi:heme A synthase